MADDALLDLWSAVCHDFDVARGFLPKQPIEKEGNVERLNEWLEQNELELALDELEMLGDDNRSPTEYWQALASAAARMGLGEHQSRLISHCTRPRNV